MASTRKLSSLAFEAALANLALAGLKMLVQAQVTAVATASTGYQITSDACRRLLCFHTATGATDIRLNVNAAATSAHLPLLPQRYVPIDAGKLPSGTKETVYFYNATGGNITVNVVELA